MAVKGIDISTKAINMARKNNENNDGIEFYVGNILNLPYPSSYFNVVFGNFILHLFPFELRRKIIEECYRVTKPGGFVIFSVASVDDPEFGHGEEKEKGFFVNSRGVEKYYYSIETVHKEFKVFSEIQIENIVEYHEHDTPHTHKSYFIFARKEAVCNG